MNEDRWRRIEEVFQAAAEAAPAERSRFLDTACRGDGELRREVESLLSYDAPDGEQLAAVVAGAAETLDSPGETGDRIGPYRVVRMLGHGGMGAVYLAERSDDQFRQQVAVKLLKRGMDQGPMLERFLHERRILARLDHPNIARLLDGGATPEGTPYLVMEYVDGSPLIDFCRDKNLSVAERLQLFRAICGAVQYAHRNLIVHRDIKPSNILVTHSGAPKLLDFGIAKLLDSTAPAVHTVRMLTPDYASPEQVLGEPVTTAGDVYSLGALLYELLTYTRAFRFRSRTKQEIEQVVCRSEPVRPSAVIAEVRERRRIEGDLDNIVLMALRKEPARRYSSPDQFADDLRRHLEGLPVRARHDTLLYRTRKFVSRARWWLGAAAVVVMSLAASIVATRVEARRAERRFQQVQRLANTFLFDFHDRIQALPGSTGAREMVVKTGLEYLNSLEAEGTADRSLQWDIANAYEKVADVQGYPFGPNLGRIDEALASYRTALAMKERLVSASPDPAGLRSLAGGYLKMGDSQIHAGDTRGARETFLKALRHADATRRQDPADLRLRGNGHSRLGQSLAMTGDLKGTVDAYRKSVDFLESLVTQEPEAANRAALAASRVRLGYILASTGDLDAALAEFRSAVEAGEEVLRSAPRNPAFQRELILALIATGDALGSPFHVNVDSMAEAIPYYERALALSRQLAEGDPRNAQAAISLSAAMRRVATTMRDKNPAEALRLYREALDKNAALAAPGTRSTEVLRDRGFNLVEIAAVLQKTGDRKGALQALHDAVEIQVRNANSDPARTQFRQDLIPTRLALGEVLMAERDLAAAKAEIEAGLSLAEAQMLASANSLYSVRNLADCIETQGRLARARGDAATAKERWRGSLELWSRWEREHSANPYQRRRRRLAEAAVGR